MKSKILATLTFLFCISLVYAQPSNTSRLDSVFQSLETNNRFMGSIAISANGNIVYSKAVGKADVEANKAATALSRYRIGSISKMFTASLVFKAAEAKQLNLNQTIDKYYPAVQNASRITIGNLLNHRSGIHNFTDDSSYLEWHAQPKSEKQLLDIIQKGKSDFEPNSKADYSNSNYVLLTFILEKVYKKNYAQLVKEKIVDPLGLKNTYVGGKINIANNEANSYNFAGKWSKEPETDMSIPRGAGAIVSTPTDLVKFIEALFAGTIISNSSLTQMKTLQDDYGMGIFQVPFYDKKGYGHTGGIDGFRSVLYYFPEEKVAIALTSNGTAYPNNDIILAGLSWYFNKPFEIPTFTNNITKTEELDQYLGVYASTDIPLKIAITKEELVLYAQATGQSKIPLDGTAKDRFEFKAAGIVMEFKPADKQFVLKQGGGVYTFTKE